MLTSTFTIRHKRIGQGSYIMNKLYIILGIVAAVVAVFLIVVLYATKNSKSALDELDRSLAETNRMVDCEFKPTESEKSQCLENVQK